MKMLLKDRLFGVLRGTGRQTDLWPTRGAGLWVCGGEPGGKPICGQPGGRALNCLHIVEFTESFRSKLYSPPALFLAVLND